MKIAIYGKQFGKLFYERCTNLFNHLDEQKIDFCIYAPFYNFLTQTAGIHPKTDKLFHNHHDLPESDLMFSIGGDGTFLDAVTMIRNKKIPMAGINSGRLGFLADISMEELPKALDDILNKRFRVKQLDLLKLVTEIPDFGDFRCALNELAIQKRDGSSMITIHTYLNDEFLTSYWADGLIVATPTGSTAYSLSVGGPILHPSSQDFVITPIAPHNLTVRPLVVPNDVELKLKVEGRGGTYLASLDSRSCILDEETELIIRKAGFSVSVIEPEGHTFYSTLRSKLMWGADKRN
ncbi:NAD kinase [Alkalitalea saponilacus]|uniref:NAD kinase n=1 Tax=Alkalitalea saponilacus TaxID=889453 RepID=A0A1T5HTN9_9BACT|nr:NAD kinase [Alkalitalea saponilacus]ASB48516.1 NAD kinase [Alkalitalea saponilacus]SKC23860.1 NAD+ kinase [Alkalitalea saponilacus]